MKPEGRVHSSVWVVLFFQVLAVAWLSYVVAYEFWPWFSGVLPVEVR